MQTSGPKSPCPVCQRTKDADCRFTTDVILCHTGSDDRPGTVITIDGQPWYLSRVNGGFDGAAAVFKPHKEGQRQQNEQRPYDLEAKAKRSTISFQITAFLDHFQQVWDTPDLHSLAPSELQEAFLRIERTAAEGLALARALAPVWRKYPDLADAYRWRVESCNKNLRYQQQDAAHFRTHYLGEAA